MKKIKLKKKTKGRSDCCNGEVMNWLGNVTAVLLGAKMPTVTPVCTICMKPTHRNK